MKTKKNIFKIAILAIACIAFTATTQAQSCNARVKSKSGTVMAAAPGKMTFRATSNNVKIVVNKTGGRAKTTVNIYANNSFKDRIIFENGRDTPSKSKTIPGVNGKNIRVDIVNQSVGNKFEYRMHAEARTTNLSKSGKVTGRLGGQIKKTIYTNASCNNKTKIIIKRTSGRARGTVRVWKKVGNSWVEEDSQTFERSQPRNQMIINNTSGKELKIELKNISVGNNFFYEMNAVVG